MGSYPFFRILNTDNPQGALDDFICFIGKGILSGVGAAAVRDGVMSDGISFLAIK